MPGPDSAATPTPDLQPPAFSPARRRLQSLGDPLPTPPWLRLTNDIALANDPGTYHFGYDKLAAHQYLVVSSDIPLTALGSYLITITAHQKNSTFSASVDVNLYVVDYFVVRVTVSLAGITRADLTPTQQDAIRDSFAAAFGLDSSQVRITVLDARRRTLLQGGGVRILVEIIKVSGASGAEALSGRIVSAISSGAVDQQLATAGKPL